MPTLLTFLSHPSGEVLSITAEFVTIKYKKEVYQLERVAYEQWKAAGLIKVKEKNSVTQIKMKI